MIKTPVSGTALIASIIKVIESMAQCPIAGLINALREYLCITPMKKWLKTRLNASYSLAITPGSEDGTTLLMAAVYSEIEETRNHEICRQYGTA